MPLLDVNGLDVHTHTEEWVICVIEPMLDDVEDNHRKRFAYIR